MPEYAAFLRGINLGPRRRVDSEQLRSLFEGMGFSDVATFRTSGNVVFDARVNGVGELTTRIETALLEQLGYEVTTFLRTAGELLAIAAHMPFAPKLVENSRGKLQVALLPSRPPDNVRADVLAHATEQDRLAFGDRELYWLPSGGTRDAALRIRAIEGLIGPTTMRTKGTIDELVARFFAAGDL